MLNACIIIGHVASHPFQAVREVGTNAYTRITDRLKELNDLVDKIQIIATTYDIAFPISCIRAELGSLAPDMFEQDAKLRTPIGLREESGTHNQLYFDQAHFANVTIDELTKMHAK